MSGRKKCDETQCFSCDKAYGLKCVWITYDVPIWEIGTQAIETRVRLATGLYVKSYKVIACPYYVPDKRRNCDEY